MSEEFVLATLIPVLDRPANVAPLVKSWEESRTPGILVFIVEHDDLDEQLAIEPHLSVAIRKLPVVDAHTWPEKINVGIEHVGAKWYLCAADDVAFGPGWWEATRDLRADSSVGVIGTNDLGNPRVLAGDHTCHPLVRGTYARSPNLDGGPFAVEAVKHWFTDDLIVAVANLRHAWAPCRDAIIEHLHPYWHNEITWDATYALGESTSHEDREAAEKWLEKWWPQ